MQLTTEIYAVLLSRGLRYTANLRDGHGPVLWWSPYTETVEEAVTRTFAEAVRRYGKEGWDQLLYISLIGPMKVQEGTP